MGLAEAQQAPGVYKHQVPTVDGSYYLDQQTGDAHTIAFCERLPSLLLISISVLWAGKDRAAFHQTLLSPPA